MEHAVKRKIYASEYSHNNFSFRTSTVSYWLHAGISNAKILVIDDNMTELKMLLELLRINGYHLSVAMDAMQGYRRATTQQYDLIILDVKMGHVDGFSTCRLLKADPSTKDIPVIFVTSSILPQERIRGLQLGAVDYISKPFEINEVLARIEIHLALAKSRRESFEYSIMLSESSDPLSSSATTDNTLKIKNIDHNLTLLRAAQRLILSDLSKVPTLPELAAQLGTHEKRLTQVFKQHTGKTIYKFIREARLHEAQRMLSSTVMHIEEVAATIGFSSSANFSTAFHSHFGCTPSDFRRSCLSQKL